MTTLTIAQGALKGGEATTENGFKYYEFLGIPYARPPVNELRFKSPQSPEAWEGIRDATTLYKENSKAWQVELTTYESFGNEDCLYLNVYTPQLASNLKLKPVMVFCHGGGFISGNGIVKEENGPDYLIEHDVVMVTLNYRLGPLGFLCLDTPEAAGNMGLKDCVKALQWVQENIQNFGGDKNNVTIFGVSAGSATCEYLLLSPLAKGLFHKCILHSGSTLNHWAINYGDTSKILAIELAKKLGYTGSDNDVEAVYQVLLTASAQELTKVSHYIATNHVSNRVFFGFVPTIERDFGNGDAFLTDHPYTILKDGKYNQVPVIRGFCNLEGTVTTSLKPTAVELLVTKKSFVDCWAYKFDDCDIAKYNPKLVTAYIKDNEEHTKEPDDYAMIFFGDLDFNAGIRMAGKLQCDKVPVYMYQFCYSGKLNFVTTLFGVSFSGAVHSDDQGYIIRHSAAAAHIPDKSDLIVKNRITKMWTNFAKTSNPTPDDYKDVQWPQFTRKEKQYLHIDKEMTIKADYEAERMAIFEEIYNKYKQ